MLKHLRRTWFLVFRLSAFAPLIFPFHTVWAASPGSGHLSDPAVRRHMVERLAQRSRERKAAAWDLARSHGWQPKERVNGVLFELMAIEGDAVYVYKTCNSNAAISIAADLVRDTTPYDANGLGHVVGIWDGGAVRATHQEFGGRVTVMETMSNSNHSTHVGGTLGAAGIQPSAEGMAPGVMIDSYEWNNDSSEMTARAMSYPHEPDKIPLSNHSYGFACGWELSYSPPRWYGTWGYRECDYFGQYYSDAAQWDQLCYDAAYYLPFKAAGNDRTDQAPAEGTTFEYYKWPKWRSKTYDSATDPYDDGWDNGGFDTILPVSSAKNIMTVGAVYDAVSEGLRDPGLAAMTSFSGWGPTDDGRIKPDVVTNGITLYSPTASSDTSYASYSGTSVASPGAAGAATLLVDYYGRLFPNDAMRASTLKALMIHTADDLGEGGPDYKFGWGLLNTQAAAEQIRDHYGFPGAGLIVEDVLDVVSPVRTYNLDWDGRSDVRVTLCWTDPPGTSTTALDNPTPRLVNDLDLRVEGPGGSVTYYPYVLNPAAPDQPATTGDNIRDNVEQVVIPCADAPAQYTVRVSHKGTLTNGQQHFSLVMNGQFTGQSWADLSDDGLVNFADLAIFCDYWLDSEPSVDVAPTCGDGIVDFLDFAIFAESWQ